MKLSFSEIHLSLKKIVCKWLGITCNFSPDILKNMYTE